MMRDDRPKPRPAPPEPVKQADQPSHDSAVWEVSHDLLLELDPSGLVLRASRSAVQVLGRDPDGLVGQSISDLVHADDRELLDRFDGVSGPKRVGSWRARWLHGAGRWVWLEAAGAARGASESWVLACRSFGAPLPDDGKESTDAAELFRILADNIPGTVYLCRNDAEYSMLFLSDAVVEVTGCPAEEFLNRRVSFVELYHPDDEAEIYARVDSALEQRRPFHLEYRLRHTDGSYRWVEEHGQGVWSLEGDLLYLEGALFDITERKTALATLSRSEERFSKVFFEHPEPAVLATLPEGRILEINPGFASLTGYERGALVGSTAVEVGLIDNEAHHQLARVLAQGDVRDVEGTIRRKDGVVRLVSFSAVELLMDDLSTALVAVRDVTERRALEQQVLRSQRMESIGTLAGGIAHDLNNVLTPILMGVQMLRSDAVGDQDELLDALEANARRGADLIRQVLAFARGAEGVKRIVELGPIVRDLARMLADTLPKSIQLHVQSSERLPKVLGDPTQIHQVLLNLCLNARDAMRTGGRLELLVEATELDEAFCETHPSASVGEWIRLSVVDDGSGIDVEHLDRIFEPFFTTKDVGEGSGLGLSTVVSIVANHDGFLDVTSRPGDGSRFDVFLPVAESAA